MRLVKSLHQSYKFTIVFVLHLPTICRYSTFAASRSSSVGAVLLFVYSIVFIILRIYIQNYTHLLVSFNIFLKFKE